MARRLKTQTDLRRYYADLIRRVEAGTLKAEVATKLTYIGSHLSKCIELQDIESMKRDIAELKENDGSWFEDDEDV
jgi:hypothetical protein